VPDQVYPLAPLQASAGQANELNVHSRALSASAASYKRLVFVDAANPKLIATLASRPHDFVIPVKGFNKDEVQVVEIGGFTPQQLQAVMVMRDRLDRVSGLSEAKRGNVSGSATATAEAIADNAIAQRQAYIRQRFRRGIFDVLRTVGWYFYYDENIVFDLDPEDGEMMLDMLTGLPAPDPVFQGGQHDIDSGLTYDDIELEIEAYSMEYTSEATLQRNASLAMQTISGIAPLIPQTPWVKWGQVLDQFGEAFNMPNMGRLVDIGMASRLAGMQAQGGEAPARVSSMAGANARPPSRQGGGAGAGGAGTIPNTRGAPSATEGLNGSASFGQQQSRARIGV
jgi:hypothetical protein